jgi:hypothetical protein
LPPAPRRPLTRVPIKGADRPSKERRRGGIT